MARIVAREDEHIDSIMRRFKRIVEKAGIPKEFRKREFYEPPSKIKKRRMAAAKKRHLKKLARERSVWEGFRQGQARKKTITGATQEVVKDHLYTNNDQD